MSYWMEESQHQNDIYMGGNYIEKTKQTIKKMRGTIRQCKNLEGIMRTKCEEGRKKCPQIKLLRFIFTHYVLHISPTSPIYSWSSTSSRTTFFTQNSRPSSLFSPLFQDLPPTRLTVWAPSAITQLPQPKQPPAWYTVIGLFHAPTTCRHIFFLLQPPSFKWNKKLLAPPRIAHHLTCASIF